jgi:hypothetical protein
VKRRAYSSTSRTSPLTCENTNTVLLYIGIVNEIIEYVVARGRAGCRGGVGHRGCGQR